MTSQFGHGAPERAVAGWYCVRCVFRWEGGDCYEERLTLWRADSLLEAIRLAEEEASSYARQSGDYQVSYAGLAQAHELTDTPGHGAEVFSLLRDSDLGPDAYLSAYFDTGQERQGTVPADTDG